MPDVSVPNGPSKFSRRTLAAGAAWSVPVIAVASAAPAYAASKGPLSFQGTACKLPGNSGDIFKGYVLYMVASNQPGPGPVNAVSVITGVTLNGASTGYSVVPVDADNDCTCSSCGGQPGCHQFCTKDGHVDQRVLIFTTTQSNSQASSFGVTYQRYECTGTSCTPFDASPVTITASLTTPPIQGSCNPPYPSSQYIPGTACS